MKPWMGWVLFTVLCWGMYVPVLHAGQLALKKSGLHAFFFVGLAYFLIAVLIPGGIVVQSGAYEVFNSKGGTLATLAGSLGALGALGIIFALKSGGHPLSVAPVVFSCAPIVNTIFAMILHRPEKAISPVFYLGCLMAAAGAYLVLSYRPQ